MSGRLDIDVSHDERMLGGLAATLLVTSLVGAALTAIALRWLVHRELRPLALLAAQTRAISPQQLHQRLQALAIDGTASGDDDARAALDETLRAVAHAHGDAGEVDLALVCLFGAGVEGGFIDEADRTGHAQKHDAVQQRRLFQR